MKTPLQQAQDERDAAIEQADANADAQWKLRALNIVERLAKDQPMLTTDDVWKEGLDLPREGRALGGVMLRARGAGLIAKIPNAYRPSVRRHCSPIQVWRSLVYGVN